MVVYSPCSLLGQRVLWESGLVLLGAVGVSAWVSEPLTLGL